jgi:general secretion pathway protein G
MHGLVTRQRAPAAHRKGRRGSPSGFTLVEMMIVVTIIMILLAMAVGVYQRSVLRAREAALHQDLLVLRKAIDNYTLDKEAAPQSLDDLTAQNSQYLREIPVDPITHQRDWHTETCDSVMSPEQTTTGICDVHSNSDAVSPFENTAYSSW